METKKRWFFTGTSKGSGAFSSKKFRIKEILTFVILLFASQLFGQSKKEAEILKISKDLFRWEIEGKIDSVANLCADKMVVVGSKGKRSKNELLADLKNGRPVHNSIVVEEASATIIGATAILVGKGVFVTTTNDNKATNHLSYMEVFVNENQSWKLIALYANRIQE